MKFVDSVEARELCLYAENSSDVYFRSIIPAMRTIEKHVKRGNFDREKAIDAFYHVADYAARAYCKEFGGDFSRVFDVTARFSAACMLFNGNEESIISGDF